MKKKENGLPRLACVTNARRDGQMQMDLPQDRGNFELNTFADYGKIGVPGECPLSGFEPSSAPTSANEQGAERRVRVNEFADHYSQARRFWELMNDEERAHVASSFVFDLSKVGTLAAMSARVIASLRNVDEELAQRVADRLGILPPKKSKAARTSIDPEPSLNLLTPKYMNETIEDRPVAMTLPTLKRRYGYGRSSAYKLIAQGRLVRVKVLGRTLVTTESADALIEAGKDV